MGRQERPVKAKEPVKVEPPKAGEKGAPTGTKKEEIKPVDQKKGKMHRQKR